MDQFVQELCQQEHSHEKHTYLEKQIFRIYLLKNFVTLLNIYSPPWFVYGFFPYIFNGDIAYCFYVADVL